VDQIISDIMILENIIHISAKKNLAHSANFNHTELRVMVLQKIFWFNLQIFVNELLQDIIQGERTRVLKK
jgi:hypothetical protein